MFNIIQKDEGIIDNFDELDDEVMIINSGKNTARPH